MGNVKGINQFVWVSRLSGIEIYTRDDNNNSITAWTEINANMLTLM